MLRGLTGRLGTIGVVLISLSCTKLPEAGTPGRMAVQDLPPSLAVVPLEWGSLVAASPMAGANASALWFQDDSGTVRLVAYDHETLQLWPQAKVIRRR